MFLEFIALKDSVADPEGRSGGCIHTPTLCSKFLSYLWVRFTTCLTPEFLKRQERIVALKWQGKRKGWGRALRWIYPLASYCLWHPCQSFPLLNCFALFCINLDPEASVNPDKQLFDSSLPFIHNC